MKVKTKKIICVGQGVEENTYHCFILDLTGTGTNNVIQIYESYNYSTSKGNLKATINVLQWDIIKDSILVRINDFMQENNYKKNRLLLKDVNYLNVLLGKEITLLFWGIEGTQNKNEIESAIRNWQGLSDIERCYLYTMTNANLSKDYNKGWRGAVKKILIEN